MCGFDLTISLPTCTGSGCCFEQQFRTEIKILAMSLYLSVSSFVTSLFYYERNNLNIFERTP